MRKTVMHKIGLILFSLGLVSVSNGQSAKLQTRIDRGVNAHKTYDLVACDSILGNILQKREKLDKKQLGEVMYFYNRNLFRLAVEEAEGSLGYANVNIQVKMYRVYSNFMELDGLGISRWSDKAKPEIDLMFKPLINAVVKCLDTYVDQGENRDPQLRDLILGYIHLASAVLPDNYIPLELEGQLLYLEGYEQEAAIKFDQAMESYRKRRMLMLDNIRMANVYLIRALMYLDEGNLDEAYLLAKEGYMRNNLEWKTFENNRQKFDPGALKDQQPIYLNNQYSLGLLELELAAQVRPNSDSTLIIYKEREDYYRADFSFQYNYAGLLEDINPREASLHYQQAIDINPASFEANYRMAQLYINLGFFYVENQDEGGKEQSNRGHQMMEIGLPYLEKAYEINPGNIPTLLLLVDTCTELALTDRVKKYKSILDSVQKP